MKKTRYLFLASLFFCQALSAGEWLAYLGDTKSLSGLGSVYARANVSVSDGSGFKVESVWLDQERYIFHRETENSRITMGREGHGFWSYDGKNQTDIPADFRDFILCHQFHAQLLNFDKFDLASELETTLYAACDCFASKTNDIDGTALTLKYAKTGAPLELIAEYEQHGTVITRYGKWKTVNGVTLPYQIIITHGELMFTYDFVEVLFNQPRRFQQLSPPMQHLTDAQQLIRLHREMIDAHIESDGGLMEHVWADNVLIVNRGKVEQVTGQAASEFMTASLASRTHSKYVDLIQPKVTVSGDGQIGWLAAQVTAVGTTIEAEPRQFEFTSAWIATFEKQDGQWKLTANASNFL